MDAPTLVVWTVLLAGGIVTYLIRASFLVGLDQRRGVPPRVANVLRFVGPAALGALVLPGLLLVKGDLALAPPSPRLLAGIGAALVAWKTRNVLFTVASGLALLYVLRLAGL